MQTAFSGNMDDCPEPMPRAIMDVDFVAEKFFLEKDHLVQVAGITGRPDKEAENRGHYDDDRAWPRPQANRFISSTLARWRNSSRRHGFNARRATIGKRNRTRNRATRFCRIKVPMVSRWSCYASASRSGRRVLRHGRISVNPRWIGILVWHLGP